MRAARPRVCPGRWGTGDRMETQWEPCVVGTSAGLFSYPWQFDAGNDDANQIKQCDQYDNDGNDGRDDVDRALDDGIEWQCISDITRRPQHHPGDDQPDNQLDECAYHSLVLSCMT